MSDVSDIGRADLIDRVRGWPRWEQLVAHSFDSVSPTQAHLAVMRQPYLSYVLSGKKSIESRFARVQAPPYGRVGAGDLLLLKEVGGAVTGLAAVVAADFYVLDAQTFGRLRDRFAPALCATDPEFWEERRDARYATLMRLGDVLPIEPLAVSKRDRRGWVLLAKRDLERGQLDFDHGDPEPAPKRQLAEHVSDVRNAEMAPEQIQLVLYDA